MLEPLFHEFGHAFALKKIEKYSAIVFYFSFVKKFRIRIFGIEIFNVRNKEYKNITYSKSDFINLTEKQKRKVAWAGIRNTIVLAIVFLAIGINYKFLLLVVPPIIMIIISLLCIFLPKSFTDFDIIKKPQEFKYKIEKYPINSPMKYENLLKEYKKK